MSTTFLVAEQELSKQIGDYWASTTTGDGVAGGTTLVDSALIAKQNDWITKESYDFLTEEPASTAAIYEERLISSLSNTLGTLTVLAHGTGGTGQIASGIDYEIHRLFSASEKRRALIAACRQAFPHIYERIWDESLVSKNWLKDGSMEKWTNTTSPTYWTVTTVTATQTSTAGSVKHGTYSATFSGSAGNISQSISNNADLMRLAGKTVTFTAQGKSNTASSLRLGILYDGTNIEYSDYHDGSNTWTEDDDPLEVTKTISDNPTDISFRVYRDSASSTDIVDDLRIIASESESPRIYIGHLGLAQNIPVQIFHEVSSYSQEEPWTLIHNVDIDHEGGYLYLPSSVPADLRLRVKGIAYLDFLASGVSSTSWTATVNLDQPQLDILIAQAILYLYQEMSMPNYSQGTREKYMEMIGYWQTELARRVGKFAMEPFSIPSKWR